MASFTLCDKLHYFFLTTAMVTFIVLFLVLHYQTVFNLNVLIEERRHKYALRTIYCSIKYFEKCSMLSMCLSSYECKDKMTAL